MAVRQPEKLTAPARAGRGRRQGALVDAATPGHIAGIAREGSRKQQPPARRAGAVGADHQVGALDPPAAEEGAADRPSCSRPTTAWFRRTLSRPNAVSSARCSAAQDAKRWARGSSRSSAPWASKWRTVRATPTGKAPHSASSLSVDGGSSTPAPSSRGSCPLRSNTSTSAPVRYRWSAALSPPREPPITTTRGGTALLGNPVSVCVSTVPGRLPRLNVCRHPPCRIRCVSAQ